MVISIVHIIICAIIINQFSLSEKKSTNRVKLKSVRKLRLLFVVAMFILVYFLDLFNIKLAYLSHQRLYLLMGKSEFFHTSFRYVFPGIEIFRLFSILPFTLILVAVSVMIYAGFYIGQEMDTFINKRDLAVDKIKDELKSLHRLLKNYAQLLSIVMVSSTIATILFFQLPISLIKSQTVKAEYINVSMAIGVCWGVIFSLTLLFLCMYPYKLAHKKITALVQSDRIRNDPDLEDWIDKHRSYYTFIWNLRLLTSIISPAAAGIITTILSNFL
jgi:hypothetical protein